MTVGPKSEKIKRLKVQKGSERNVESIEGWVWMQIEQSISGVVPVVILEPQNHRIF